MDGRLRVPLRGDHRADGRRRASTQAGRAPRLRARPSEETVAAAIELLREYNVSQLPVMKEEPPVMAAEVIGSVVERDLLDALVSGRASPQDSVGGHMSAPLPMIGSGDLRVGDLLFLVGHARVAKLVATGDGGQHLAAPGDLEL